MVAYNIEAVTQAVATSTNGDDIIRLKTILIDWQLHLVLLRPMQARHRAASSRLLLYQFCPSVRPSVCPSVTLLGSAKTVRDSALVTMGS